MKHLTRALCFVLIAILLLSLAACSGSDKGGSDKSDDSGSAGSPAASGSSGSQASGKVILPRDTDLKFYNEDYPIELGTPAKALDPAAVFASLEITPDMLYGSWFMEGGEAAMEDYKADSDYMLFEEPDAYYTKDRQITAIPYKLEAGPRNLSHVISSDRSRYYLHAYFQSDKGNLVTAYCAYVIENGKLTLYPVEHYDYDSETKTLSNVTFRDFSWSYDFTLQGGDLTLKKDGKSMTLRSLINFSGDQTYVYVEGYLRKGAETLEGLDFINLCCSPDGDYHWIGVGTAESSYISKAAAVMTQDGLLTLTYVDKEDQSHTFQMAYLYMYREGMILTDGEKTYRYTYGMFDRDYGPVEDFVVLEEGQEVKDLEEEQVKAAMEKKDDLLADLTKAFADAGIAVTVDPESGELAMDTSVLFGGDSAELSDEGKALLDQFLAVYTSIVYNEKYNGFVTATVVEGHTAPLANSTYESGLPLSEQRAAVVMEYCLSGQSGIDPAVTESLAGIMRSAGCSNLFPVRNADGSVNLEASRRVCFRFYVDVTKAQ